MTPAGMRPGSSIDLFGFRERTWRMRSATGRFRDIYSKMDDTSSSMLRCTDLSSVTAQFTRDLAGASRRDALRDQFAA